MKKTLFLTVILILAFSLQAYTQTCSPAPTGLVSWWSGDNNSLDSRSRNNGTLQNGATYASGKVGQGFSFDGVDDRVFVPHNANLNVANVTLEAWVFPTAFGGEGSIINKRTAINNAGYGLEPTAGGNISFFIFIGGNSFFVTSTSQLTLNTWSHVAGTFDGSNLKVFINGVQDGSTSAIGSIDSTTGDLVIGENIVNGTNWSGLIDEPTVYNRALSAIELQAISNAGTSGKCKPTATVSPSGLVGFWAGDGNANDNLGLNNGSLQLGAGFAVGKVGQAFSFDGIDDYVQTGLDVQPTAMPDVTFEGWVFPRSPSGFDQAIFSSDDAGWDRQLGISPSGANFRAQTGSSSAFDAGTVDYNQWQHIAVVYTTTNIKFYKNGVEFVYGSPATGQNTLNTLVLGANRCPILCVGVGATQQYNGLIDEPAVYNRALSQAEIQSIYNAGIAGKLKDNTTATGSNVAVNTKSDATVTFPNVTTAGITQQIPIDLASFPNLPNGFTATGLAYDLATSATYSGSPNVCFNVPSVTTSNAFNNLRILHFESNTWTNRTGTIDFNTKTICSSGLTSLSPFAIVNSAPTAANASVSGKILTAKGRGMARVGVILQNVNTGEIKQVLTNNFGSFNFEDLPSGDFYILSVNKKGYQFSPNQQSFQLNENLADLNIVGTPY